MLVRSQDRESFVNINSIKKMDIFQKATPTGFDEVWNIDCPSVGIGSNVIGRYSTKEKAIKVIDMICSAYDAYSRACINYSKTGWDLYQTVFDMPKDEDVVITDGNGEIPNGN
jgi:hypothetical protein